jgi:carboxylesterase type B
VAGQSSGGTAIFALYASPLAKGLFHKAIALSGSPNMTTSLAAAEIQNEPIIKSTGCKGRVASSSSEVMACLRAMNATSLVKHIPNSWNTPGIFGLPKDPAGMNWAALAIVDGVTVTMPFDKAMAAGLNDVPLMFGSMGQEPDESPDDTVASYSADQWKSYLNTVFKPWDNVAVDGISMGDQMYNLYLNESSVNAQKAYDAIVSDYGISCGYYTIAKQAQMSIANGGSGNFKSNIYLYSNQWAFSSGVIMSPVYTAKFAFHYLDYLYVTEGWSGLGQPQQSDYDIAAKLQDNWYSFMLTGIPSEDWLPFNHYTQNQGADGNISDYNVYVYDRVQGSGNRRSYNQERCDFLISKGIATMPFWWAN